MTAVPFDMFEATPLERAQTKERFAMRQFFAPAGALAIILTLVVGAPLTASAQVAKIEPMSIDFGQMNQMKSVTTIVTVTNEGAGRLLIESVDPDCGCTVPTLTQTSLGPGESTPVEIEFNSKRFNGPVHKVVHFNTNDPLNPVVDFMITANVYAPLVIEPNSQRLGFERSLAGETPSRRVIFTAAGDEPLVIEAGATRKGLFLTKVINNLDGDPHRAALEVTVPADMAPGRQRDNIRVTTNIADFPTADIEMQAWVVEELVASPERVAYRFKKNFKQSIRVAPFRKGIAYKVTKVECDLPEISYEVVETIPNEETKILLTGTPLGKDDPRSIAAEGRLKGELKVYTNLKTEPTLIIPISYMVRM